MKFFRRSAPPGLPIADTASGGYPTSQSAQERGAVVNDEFLAMLAHELRNPLAPIRNAAALLHRLKKDDSRLAWISDLLDRQIGQLSRFIDDLVDVSRATQGYVALHNEAVNVERVIANAVEATLPLIHFRRQELHLALPEQPIWVLGDPIRLTQIFENLLNNSAKYTDESGWIGLKAEAGENCVTVFVRDSGMGIAPDFLPRIFDLFAQSDRTLDRPPGGLGIGLTLVRRLVEMHGGSITASSEGVGRGSEFRVCLPTIALPPAKPG